MARSLLNTTGQAPQTLTPLKARAGTPLTAAALDAKLRQKRSKDYIAAVRSLDAAVHVADQSAAKALLDAIKQELPDIEIDALPLGIVAKCYLGPPHEVHTLDCVGNIVRHYKVGEALAPLMERARVVAQHPAYAFIEVYPARLIAVSENGQTAVIEA